MATKITIGVDVGGINTVFGIVDAEGNILAENSFPTKQYDSFETFVTALSEGINSLMAGQYELLGIGLGAPNASSKKGIIKSPANIGWGKDKNFPIKQELEKNFPHVKIAIDNDANAAAVGEMMYGGAKGMKDFAVVTLGTGVGSGIIIDGELLYGSDGFAGELGHIIVTPDGLDCSCGRQGCLETYVSAIGIKRTVYKLLADRCFYNDNYEGEFKDIGFRTLTSEMIYNAAVKGDPIALEAFQHTGAVLGRALANLAAITAPEAIFLFGGLARAGDLILNPARQHMEENMLFIWKRKVKLLLSELNEANIAVLGAAALALKEVNSEKK
jgi:glucokinase